MGVSEAGVKMVAGGVHSYAGLHALGSMLAGVVGIIAREDAVVVQVSQYRYCLRCHSMFRK